MEVTVKIRPEAYGESGRMATLTTDADGFPVLLIAGATFRPEEYPYTLGGSHELIEKWNALVVAATSHVADENYREHLRRLKEEPGYAPDTSWLDDLDKKKEE